MWWLGQNPPAAGPGTSFEQLGLLVVDEEQARFGVRRKEKIKAAAAKNRDVLNLLTRPHRTRARST